MVILTYKYLKVVLSTTESKSLQIAMSLLQQKADVLLYIRYIIQYVGYRVLMYSMYVPFASHNLDIT